MAEAFAIEAVCSAYETSSAALRNGRRDGSPSAAGRVPTRTRSRPEIRVFG